MRYLSLFLIVVGLSCNGPEESPIESAASDFFNQDTIFAQVSKNWDDVVAAWYPRALDTTYGGYLANWSYDWQMAEEQNKMIVTQARHLWTTSKLLEENPEDSLFKQATKMGFDFLKNKMWDQQQGGFYWLVDRQGNPILEGEGKYKKVYGHAFGVYAVAAYAHASQSDEALDFAQETFRWVNDYYHDTENSGYYSVVFQNGQPLTPEEQSDQGLPVSWLYKEQNAGIHLMEAFTELYRVWPDSTVQKSLVEMFHLVRDTMVKPEGYLSLYFTPNWTPISYMDSSQAAREANYQIEHVSFGHDIETAFLMLDASLALDSLEYDETLTTAKKLVDHTLDTGFDPVRSGIYQRGYYLPNDTTISIIDSEKDWWSQAEGLNTLLLFSSLYPDESKYADSFARLWKYTRTYIIDYKNGGWYGLGLDVSPEANHSPKGQAWKGNYHNGRTLMALKKKLHP